MAALLSDFEYDIFISYRHNDEEWMADFIDRLQREVKMVVGRELRIYYDRDVKNGLNDTYQVRESLDHRVLSSVILMPLISATYCDTTKYSWNYEFLPFLEHAKKDRLGLNLTLLNRNVSSRILPLRTYDLEPNHSQLLAQTLGGFLRSIDFVYLAQGVNRPLRVKDEDWKPGTVNGLLYVDQINKVANTIKELLDAAAAMPAPSAGPVGAEVAPSTLTVATTTPLEAPAATTATITVTAPMEAPAAAPASVAAAATGPIVFLAWTTSPKMKARREDLALVCAKAGLRVVPTTDRPAEEEDFKDRTNEELDKADCSLHLLGNDFGQLLGEDGTTSLPKYAYDQARQQAARRPAFRQFVWFSPEDGVEIKPTQQAFVNQILNELTAQCTLSRAPNAPQVVEELRTALVQAAPPPVSAAKETDICFIANALDRDEAEVIVDRLCDDYDYKLNVLTVAPNNADYKEMMAQAIPKSRLAVVYYKDSADWALPFLNQVYQLMGGANSPMPFLFVGEDEHPEQSGHQGLRTKNLISRLLPHQGVSGEVQRVFQKVNNASPA
jgi:hypothetical protein